MVSRTLPPIHPLCHLFPIMPDQELYGLAEDIRRRGLLESIVLLDGQVLDGRNRLEACRLAGVEPRFVDWKGDDSPLEWAIAKKMRRRQFNASQRAVIALAVLPLLEKEAKERMRHSEGRGKKGAHQCAPLSEGGVRQKRRAADDAAKLLGASPRYIQAAKQVRRFCPDLLFHVVQGRINLIDAQLAMKLPNPQRQVVLERVAKTPRGVPLHLRRLIQEDLAFLMGREVRLSDPPWIGRNAKEKDLDYGPTADWQEVRYIITNKQLDALDNGEEIFFPIAGRACLVRLSPNPTPQEAAIARGDLILPDE
jgi:hypothetical protein